MNDNKVPSQRIKCPPSETYQIILIAKTPLQKLLGKSSIPCHITHIYQDAAWPLRLGFYQIICSQNSRKGTHYNQPDFVWAVVKQYSGMLQQAKANYGEHNTGSSGALIEWMTLSCSSICWDRCPLSPCDSVRWTALRAMADAPKVRQMGFTGVPWQYVHLIFRNININH